MKDKSGRQWWFLGPDGGAVQPDINGKPVNIRVHRPCLHMHMQSPCSAMCSLYVALAALRPPPHLNPAPPQSYGRSQERNASCPTYVSANAGCGFSWPTLARAPSPDTKWIFDPAPGGIYKWYIRMSVSKEWPGLPVATDVAAVPAAAAAAARLLPRLLPLDGRTFPGAR